MPPDVKTNLEPYLRSLNRRFEGLSLEERLKDLVETCGTELGMTSAFGYSGVILMYHLQEIYPEIPIYFIDTRFHFDETLQFIDQLENSWNLNVHRISTDLDEGEIEDRIGSEAWNRRPDDCCHLRKVVPLLKILPKKSVWLHALRRDQAESRKNLKFFEVDSRGTNKVYPMVDWTRKQCWQFIENNNLPYHPMHDENYPSIGCTHCTEPVSDGEHERAGRWVSHPSKGECGLHDHNSDD